MVTVDDAMFSILHSCVDSLDSSRLIYYIYLFQQSRLNFKFKFKLNASGLVCKGLASLLDDLINQDKIDVSNAGVLTITKTGYLYYDNIVLTLEEWEFFDKLKNIFDNLTENELFFICITDMIVYDVLNKYGGNGLITRRQNIINSISALSSEYSNENFNTALQLIRHIKEGFEK